MRFHISPSLNRYSDLNFHFSTQKYSNPTTWSFYRALIWILERRGEEWLVFSERRSILWPDHRLSDS